MTCPYFCLLLPTLVAAASTCLPWDVTCAAPEVEVAEEFESLLVETNFLQTHSAHSPPLHLRQRLTRRSAKRRTCSECGTATCFVDGHCWAMGTEEACNKNGGTFCSSKAPTPGSNPIGGSGPQTPISGGGGSATAPMKALLASHNELRANHGAPALEWDDGLAQQAQPWADACVFTHSSFGNGENLAAHSNGWSGDTAIRMTQSWYSEIKDVDWSDPESGLDSAGHFTQLVWKSSTRIGCAQAWCEPLAQAWGGSATFLVCEYTPAGNMMGAAADNVLPPSSLMQMPKSSEKFFSEPAKHKSAKASKRGPPLNFASIHGNETKTAFKRVAATGDCAEQCFDNFPCLWGDLCWGVADQIACEGFAGTFCGGACTCADYADYPCELSGECWGYDVNQCVDQGGHYCGAYHGISTGDGGNSGGGSSGSDGGGGGLAECAPCTESSQCANQQGFCCPYMHKCVASSSTMC